MLQLEMRFVAFVYFINVAVEQEVNKQCSSVIDANLPQTVGVPQIHI